MTRLPSTEKTDDRILFSRLRFVALHEPHRSRRFIAWLKSQEKKGEFHHVFGSVHKLKSTDLLGVIVEDHQEHMTGEQSIQWLMQQVPEAVANLLDYVKYLEAELEARS